jgi:hypothetical protein
MTALYSPLDWTHSDLARIAAEIDPLFPIDLGIVRAVKILRDAGIATIESCEGGEGHSYPEPTIKFAGGREVGWAAISALMTFALPIRRLGQMWTFQESAPTGPHWFVTFWGKL